MSEEREVVYVDSANDGTDKMMSRNAIIVRTSIIGIVANCFLAGFKAVVGVLSNSIAIVMDAVNNISDAASSVITIVGTKLASKPADKKHPFGYGRVEYLSAMVIALLVLYAGVTAFVESVKKIIAPEVPDYEPYTLIIVAVAVVVKLVLGRYVKSVGDKVNSDSLVNSGKDAMLDAVISVTTLIAAAIYIFAHISLEAWLGAIIALVIVKSGIEMLQETISQVLGERIDSDLVKKVKTTVNGYPEVNGSYDLILHNYGPDAYTGSIHIEVNDDMSMNDLDKLGRRIAEDVYLKHGIILTAVGVYSIDSEDPEVMEARKKVRSIVMDHEYVLQVHGFYLDKANKSIRFDMVISLGAPDRGEVYDHVVKDVEEAYPGYVIQAVMDTDYSEK